MPDSKNVVDPPEFPILRQKRALLTRQELLRSARAIFASNGFEHARIEDIASKAGKTRGAFYDNFKSKEDVFYAIFEENIDRDTAQLGPLLQSLPAESQRIEAFAEFLIELSKDRERILLDLEFKLYAIRHPRKLKRLADLYTRMCLSSSIPEIMQLLPQLGGNRATSQQSDSLAIGSLIDGLGLNHFFDPDVMDAEELARYMKLCLRKMLEKTPDTPPQEQSSKPVPRKRSPANKEIQKKG
jgi:AcrR family transcriptional regulator